MRAFLCDGCQAVQGHSLQLEQDMYTTHMPYSTYVCLYSEFGKSNSSGDLTFTTHCLHLRALRELISHLSTGDKVTRVEDLLGIPTNFQTTHQVERIRAIAPAIQGGMGGCHHRGIAT